MNTPSASAAGVDLDPALAACVPQRPVVAQALGHRPAETPG